MRTTAANADALVRVPPRDPAMCCSTSTASSASSLDKRPPHRHQRNLTNQSHSSDATCKHSSDDDDLDLPEITAKPLSSAASIAKFHRSNTNGDSKPRRTAASATKSSREHRHRRQLADDFDLTIPTKSAPTNPEKSEKKPKRRSKPTSSKQVRSANRLNALVIHSVTPRESSALATNGNSFPGSYTEYEVVVENVRTSQLWMVSRRFSTFVYFRKELTALFATPHCHFCTEMHLKLDQLHDDFPRKRIWGSNKPSVIHQRAEKLQVYLQGLLALGARVHTKGCRLVASNFSLHLRSFLTVEGIQFHGIPGGGGTATGHSVPSLLHEMASGAATGSNGGGKLATIQENSASHLELSQFLGLDADTEDEEDDTSSTSDDATNQYEDAPSKRKTAGKQQSSIDR